MIVKMQFKTFDSNIQMIQPYKNILERAYWDNRYLFYNIQVFSQKLRRNQLFYTQSIIINKKLVMNK